MSRNTKEFVQNAQSFIAKDNASLRRRNKIYLIFAFSSLFLAVLAIIAVMLLTPLKTVEPYLIKVDKNTGQTEIITTLDKERKSYSEVIDNHFLSQYVMFRESYDWERISDYYAATKLMSNDVVRAQYIKFYGKDNINSPVNTFKNRYRILVKISSISYIGSTAQVRFRKIKVPTMSSREDEVPQEFHYLATINFDYQDKEMTSAQRQVNPLGFTVTSYEVSSDEI
ncbi:MAG: type IV secretion system protein [Neisseriaceae bacterium]|nr:type IV secretion system protein [Neisseriaceae bacterium]